VHAAGHPPIQACEQLLKTEAEVLKMPSEQVNWFMSKQGHAACFAVAHYVLSLPRFHSTAADLEGIRALLEMYCFCVSNQDNLLCKRCAALTAWADTMDQRDPKKAAPLKGRKKGKG
jgi:hypothetical protein